jgi:hypothetical protein
MKNLKNEEGYPRHDDYFSSGSEITAKNSIETPEGLLSFIPGPVVNIHQNPSDAKPVGTTGSTYTPHPEDEIFRTVSGHSIIYGNAPGNETLRIQSAKNSCIEFGSDGALQIAVDGLRIAVDGDKNVVVSGDYTIVCTGDLKFKAPRMIFDTNEIVTIVKGNKTEYIAGNLQQEIKQNRNTHVVGDDTLLVTANQRYVVGENYRQQTLGEHKLEVGNNLTNLVKGEYYLGTTDSVSIIADKSIYNSAKQNIEIISGDSQTISSANNIALSTKNNISMDAKASITGNAVANISFTSNHQYLHSKTEFSILSTSYIQRSSNQLLEADASGVTNLKSNSTLSLDTSGNIYLNDTHTGIGNTITPATPVTAHYSSATSAKRPEMPLSSLVKDALSDNDATGGQIDQIWNAEQIEFDFIENTDNSIPTNVLNRMQEKGIFYIPVKYEIVSSINVDNINVAFSGIE